MYEGELELRGDALRFNRKKGNRLGTFAVFGFLGLAFASPYDLDGHLATTTEWITSEHRRLRIAKTDER
jgi:hypothetical protein